MYWLRQLWARLFCLTPAAAQSQVDKVDRKLAELRAKVRTLPTDQQAAFTEEIHAMIEEQAHARNALNDVLDDRHER
jgi:hypothetical protein